MRKQLVIVGHSREGLELVPLLEANPGVEICWLISDDVDAIHRTLTDIDATLAQRFADRVSSNLDVALAIPGLTTLIDAEAPKAMRRRIAEARGVQVTTPVLAKLLFAFGPADAYSKPELLQALRDILDSYDLALDRRGLLNRVLQIAVSATGADRGSIMLWDPKRRVLRVDVSLGIEEELIPKIQVPSGEGVAGRAFAAERPILVNGKADRRKYQITRERDDIGSAISAPLVNGDQVIGVLNVSHARDQDVFDATDLEFVEQLARLDARLIARAEEYHGLLRESETLRTESQVRRLMSGSAPLAVRLESVCFLVAGEMEGALCQLYLCDTQLEMLLLHTSSAGIPPLSAGERIEFGEGLPGWVASHRERVFLNGGVGESGIYYACFPLQVADRLLGVLVYQGAGTGSAAENLEERLTEVAAVLGEELDAAIRSAKIERESLRTRALSELLVSLGSCEREERYGCITASAAKILEAQDAVLRLREGDSGRFRIVSWTGVGQWREGPLATFEKKLAAEAIRTRQTVRVADLDGDSALTPDVAGIGSAMVHPLLDGKRVIGSLSALGKIPEEPLLGELFDEADEQILRRLAEYAQSSVAEPHDTNPPTEQLDSETGLLGPRALRTRLEEELARSQLRGHSLALVHLRFPGLAESGLGGELAGALADAMRLELREFDILARPSADVFAVLLPEPEPDISRLLGALNRVARSALEDCGEGSAGIEPSIGYAHYPEDGDDAAKLEARASRARVEAL